MLLSFQSAIDPKRKKLGFDHAEMSVDMPVYSINTLSADIPATQLTMKFVILNKLYLSRCLVDLSCNNTPVNDDIPESIQQIETEQLKLKS